MLNSKLMVGSSQSQKLFYSALFYDFAFFSVLIFLKNRTINFLQHHMLSHNSSRGNSPLTSRRPSPKNHLLTLRTDRIPSISPNNNDPNRLGSVAASPTARNKTKIHLVSPIKHQIIVSPNNITPLMAENVTPAACSPNRLPRDIELGGKVEGKPKRKLNDISNISIKEHLHPDPKKTSPTKPIPAKYSAFIIMPADQPKQAQTPPVPSFRKQVGPFITINNKPFDVSNLQSHVIHVSPFRHVTPWSPSPTIREETENSTLKEQCEEELRQIKDLRRQMEAESSRIKEALKSSKIQQEECVSRLFFANQTDNNSRTHSRNPSKLLNFEDVPLHQSRMKAEEKHAVGSIRCEVEESLITREIKCHPFHQPIPNDQTASSSNSAKEQTQYEAVQHHSQLPIPNTIKESYGPSQKTIINELNFATSKKLGHAKDKESRVEEICVQTDREEGSEEEEKSKRLAICINQDCRVTVEATSQPQQTQLKDQKQAVMVELSQHSLKNEQDNLCEENWPAQQQMAGFEPIEQPKKTSEPQNEQQCEQQVETNQSIVQPQQAPLIPSVEVIAQLSKPLAQVPPVCIADSNLSLQLHQPQEAGCLPKRQDEQSIKNSQQSFQPVEAENDKRDASKKASVVYSLRSVENSPSSYQLASKRSINNRIYM